MARSSLIGDWRGVAGFVLIVVAACGGSSSTGPGDGIPGGAACTANAATACGNRKCDASLGCVQCVADTDCGAGSPFCIRGSCGACRSNTDCGAAAPACWPGDHTCRPSCTAGTACGMKDTKVCDAATGACLGCQTAADCGAGEPICDATTKSCVACAVNSDCPATKPRCSPANGRCVACLSNADCGTAAPPATRSSSNAGRRDARATPSAPRRPRSATSHAESAPPA